MIRLIVGESDKTTPPIDTIGYAELLVANGIDAEVTLVPKLGHSILFAPIVFDELTKLVERY